MRFARPGMGLGRKPPWPLGFLAYPALGKPLSGSSTLGA